MECFVIFVMAWCWFNATESKPHNVSGYLKKDREKDNLHTDNYNWTFKL